MRGSAAPTSPGAWDARSEALLGTPALTAAGTLDLRAPAPEDPVPSEIAPPREATPTPPPCSGTAWDAPAPAVTEGQEPPSEAAAPTDAPAPTASHPAPTAPGPAPEPAARPEPAEPTEGTRVENRPADGTALRPAPAAVAADGTAPRPAPAGTAADVGARPRSRRGQADPVKVLMHRHRELCERAVDPLEIAAGLEAQGFTDRTAARFRHRDVFSLAEELYARVPRGPEGPAPVVEPERARAPWAPAVLAPGGVAGLTALGLASGHGPVRLAVGAAGALALGGALLLAVRQGPFRAPDGGTVPAARLWTLWLLAYAVGGDGLLDQVLTGGPDGPWELTTAPLLGLALAVAPAAWGAHLFASRARRRIADSRGLADFAAAVRPLLLGTVTLQLLALTGLLVLTGFSSGALALGALLLLARLHTVHGHPEAAAAVLAAACAGEVLALASVLAARVPLPGFDALAVPVRALVEARGPGAVPTLVCGAAALGLLAHATGALARASAHATP
ncbi:hypothetical protein GCM10010275_03390 [Streptomyces litmocidini]|uniref:hypothetical protein n=1 Tax=Streptomyces litmocidini TaxID=67318 RepID=UPI00198FF534|nr:hypothetical protein GCM10010275_03390 [Streptomyces litmocidini]